MAFADCSVPYEVFVLDVAAAVVELMKGPEYICQNEAFRRFGRRNVERWRRTGQIQSYDRPGKREYKLVELKRLKETQQDYLKR